LTIVKAIHLELINQIMNVRTMNVRIMNVRIMNSRNLKARDIAGKAGFAA